MKRSSAKLLRPTTPLLACNIDSLFVVFTAGNLCEYSVFIIHSIQHLPFTLSLPLRAFIWMTVNVKYTFNMKPNINAGQLHSRLLQTARYIMTRCIIILCVTTTGQYRHCGVNNITSNIV